MQQSTNTDTPQYRLVAPGQFASKVVLLGLFTGGALAAGVGGATGVGLGIAGGTIVAVGLYVSLLSIASRLGRKERLTTDSVLERSVVAADGGCPERRE